MSLIDDFSEQFEIITPNGYAYGKVKVVLTKISYPFMGRAGIEPYYDLVAHSSEKIQEYDILKRCEDGKTFRVISIDKSLMEKNLISATVQPYEIWDN